MKDFIEATHNLFQIQQKRIDELEIKLQAQHHTPRQLEYMAHKRASRFKAHLAEKIHTGSPDTYQGCGGSCAICLKDMTSGESVLQTEYWWNGTRVSSCVWRTANIITNL